MNRLVLSTAAVAFGLLLGASWSDTALAERRVALVLGNSAYQNAPNLPNPTRDAKAMVAVLKQAGFDVVSAYNDVGNLQFKRALRQFEDIAADADISVVFYAGHGIEIRGVNYMIPVDARLASDRDADDEAITLERLLESVAATRRLSLIILDACRDNPFVPTMKRQRTAAVRAISPGLGLVGPTKRNMLIAYAAKAGTVAEDGDMQHSPFTAALLNHLFVPGLELRLALGRVRDQVLKSTGSRQEPFVSGSLGGDYITLVPASEESTNAGTPANSASEKNDYDLVKEIGTKGAWEVFLNQYPSGFYADLARQQLRKLEPPPQAQAQRVAREPEAVAPAALTLPNLPSPASPPSEEQVAWDKIKDSSNVWAFRDFIKRYPSSALATTARRRLEEVERASQEREEEGVSEREGQAAAVARKKAKVDGAKPEKAARQRAGTEPAKQEPVDRAKQETAAETARQQAESKEALKRADQERQAALRAMQDADCRREEELLIALKAAGDHGWAKADLKRLEQRLTCEWLRPEVLAALSKATAEPGLQVSPVVVGAPKPASNTKRAEEDRREVLGAKPDADCRREEELLVTLKAAGDQGWARADLKRLEQRLTCERLRPDVLEALKKKPAEPK